ncbi:MAG: hypothetical protein IPL88_13645 [Rhizobiales bacterium]|nr:hypothetical protein [Hyphomicrobiales bacterium]
MARDESAPRADGPRVNRRSALRAIGAAAASVPLAAGEAAAQSASDTRKTKARFKADAADVQTFYRVNRY